MSETRPDSETYIRNYDTKRKFVDDFLTFAARVNADQLPYSHGSSEETSMQLGTELEESNVVLWVLKQGVRRIDREQWKGKKVIYPAVATDVVVNSPGNYPPEAKDVVLRVTSEPPAVYFRTGDNLTAVEPDMPEWEQAKSLAGIVVEHEQSLTRTHE